MGVNLSIKDVPAEQVAQLKARAKRNHRSLQGELRAIVEAACEATASSPKRKMSIKELGDYIGSLGLTSAKEATARIREDCER